MNPKYHCHFNAILQAVNSILKSFDFDIFSNPNTKCSLSNILIDSACKASRSYDLYELKSSLSKYDSFCNGLTQQDAFRGFLLLMSILNKGSWNCFLSNYDFTATPYDGWLSDYLFSFNL